MPGHDGVSLASFVLGGDSRRRTGFVGIGACVFAGLHCSEETLEGRRLRGRIGDESLPGPCKIKNRPLDEYVGEDRVSEASVEAGRADSFRGYGCVIVIT